MGRIEDTTLVAGPIDEVFGFLADPNNHLRLGRFMSEVDAEFSEDWGAGSTYREKSGPGPLKSWTKWTVAKFDAPWLLSYRSEDGGLTATGTWRFETTDRDETRVYQVTEFSVDVGFGVANTVLDRVFGWLMSKESKRALTDLVAIFDAY